MKRPILAHSVSPYMKEVSVLEGSAQLDTGNAGGVGAANGTVRPCTTLPPTMSTEINPRCLAMIESMCETGQIWM